MARKKAIRRHTGGSKKILVIISNHEFKPGFSPNIVILRDFMKQSGYEVEYAGISNSDDFKNYENIVTFKYKEVNPRKQFNKICDFITKYPELRYDWYVKIRPDIKLLEPLKFENYSVDAINSKARVYNGPRTIPYGLNVGGKGDWSDVEGHYNYSPEEHDIILDDSLYIFTNKMIELGAFAPSEDGAREDEWFHTGKWNTRKIPLNVIGTNTIFLKGDGSFRSKGANIPPKKMAGGTRKGVKHFRMRDAFRRALSYRGNSAKRKQRKTRKQKGGDGFQSDMRTIQYYTPKSREDYGEIDDVGRLGAKVV